MERVLGIGGFFFRSVEPDRLGRWYADHLGVDLPPATYDNSSWRQEAGPTVFAAFPRDTDHLEPPTQPWKLNFRVGDLDAMVAQLRDAGIVVEEHAEVYPNGRFAELTDPEGNPIQLWEPAGADSV